jgi:uncharacterized repeat protein (TIGR02543 family)
VTQTDQPIVNPGAPTRTGYDFTGWFTASSGGTKILSWISISDTYTHGQTEDFTLYAQWNAIPYSITYNVNGGSSDTPTIGTKFIGDTFTVAAAPTRAGYTFLGWRNGASNFAAGSTYTVASSNIVLTAQWSANTIAVTLDSRGGSALTSITTRTDEVIANDPGTPTRAGYDFAGWTTVPDSSTVGFAYTHNQTDSFTLFAKWNAKALNITYDNASGTTVSGGDTSTLTAATITTLRTVTLTGWTFNGWFTASTGGTKITTSDTHNQTANFTLYAQWSKIAYRVAYDLSSGTGDNAVIYTESVKTIGDTFTVKAAPSRVGYTFGKWSDNTNT